MKVKNMVRNRQSTYSKLVQFSSKNLKSSFLVSLVALILAFIASIVSNSILVCLLSIISLVISGAETVFKLIKGTKDAKVDTLLIVAAVLICFCLGNFNVAASAMALYKFLSTVIAYVLGILGKDLKAIVEVSPKYANEIDYNSDIRVIPSENIVKGTKIMVKVGEVVPVDCIITEGFSEFDTSRVYESDEQSFSSGDKLLAGFINTGSSVTCVALCDYDESLVKDLNRLSDMAEVTSTIGEKRFLKIAKWYPLLVLVLAIAVLIIGGIL